MRRTILVLTIICCAPTAVMALTAGRAIIGDSELGASGPAIQQGQIAPGGIVGSGQDRFLGGKVILAKGDQSGSGPGKGGHKGAHKAEGKGSQAESKAAKGSKGGPQGGPAQPRR
jgi:hypothetical protein